LGIEKERLGGDCHGYGPVNLFEEVVDDGCWWFARFVSAWIFDRDFFAIRMVFHK
jgi:hypothetical protein